MPATILIVEDEPDLVDILVFNLEKEGFATRRALTGQEGLAAAALEPVPDLVLLDLMLPDMSGTEICRCLRASERTRGIPVIMLTARSSELDRVVGFEVGADDYVTKPFSVRELLLRIRAVLRRVTSERHGSRTEGAAALDTAGGTTSAAPDASTNGVRTHGRLRIHGAEHRLWVDDEPIKLTSLEFRLLLTLLERAGRVQTRDTLLADVWEMQAGLTTRTVDTHVTRLRKKLGGAGEYIETLRGVGYRFRARGELD